MASKSERLAPHPGMPPWDHPTGWALWHLSLVLKEISENLEPCREKNEAVGQTSAADTLMGGSKQGSPDE